MKKKLKAILPRFCLWVSQAIKFSSIQVSASKAISRLKMSSTKIVIKKSAAAAVIPKASVVSVPKKIVVAPSIKVQPAKKVVVKQQQQQQQEDASESESESESQASDSMTRDEMLVEALNLLSQALGMKAGLGKGKKSLKFNKDGSMRQPRGPRENSEKQSAWMEYVKEVRSEQGVDENGKFLISHKDAMKLAKELRAESSPVDNTVVNKKKVVPAKKAPQEIRAEFLKKAAAAASVQPQVEEDTEVEVEEFEFEGKTYLKNSDNLCWLTDSDGNQTWAGVYLPHEDRIDDSVEEPTA